MNEFKIMVPKEDANTRLDLFLIKCFPDHSRSYFSALIKDKNILVNSLDSKPNYKVKSDDNITGKLAEKTTFYKPSPEKIPLNIIFESDDVLILNKQPGIVVHPSAGHHDGTLVNAVLAHDPKINEAVYDKDNPISLLRPGLVHRLDKDTSGIIIFAKNARSMFALSKEIHDRRVKKVYWAICIGWPKHDTDELIGYLGRSPKNRRLMAEVGEERGKKAVLSYKVVNYFEDNFKNKLSLIEFDLKTGRTHQIRVQASGIGCPVLGDREYGNKNNIELANKLGAERQMLHAKEISIALPGDEARSVFMAPIPEDMSRLLNCLTEIK